MDVQKTQMDYTQLNNKCKKGIFQHYISLGHCCNVAIDLEKMGLRDASMPFDWTRTRWKAILRSFNQKFDGYLNYNELYQKKDGPHIYKNLEYGIGFFHDFVAYKSLRSQIKSVKKKYDRRIKRFFDRITSPTLFIRYCWDKDELITVENSYSEIKKMIKHFNEENEIVFISHDRLDNSETSKIDFLFYIEKNPDEELNESPIMSSKELYGILNDALYPQKQANLIFEQNKKTRKPTIWKRIKKKLKALEPKKVYKHPKQC